MPLVGRFQELLSLETCCELINNNTTTKMGISSDLFLDKVSEDLICPICFDVFDASSEPVMLSCCNNLFCKPCIQSINRGGNGLCPLDRKSITASTMQKPIPIIMSIIGNLRMMCQYYPDCREIFLNKEAAQHQGVCKFDSSKIEACAGKSSISF